MVFCFSTFSGSTLRGCTYVIGFADLPSDSRRIPNFDPVRFDCGIERCY